MQVIFLLSTIFLSFASFVLSGKNYYQILGVDKAASDKEIKQAYRQLTLKYHPDKNPGDEEAHDKFIEIGEAYEALSDETKRKNYDMYGDVNGPNQQHQGGFDFGDIFGQFFGGGGGGGGDGGHRARGGNGGQQMKRGSNTNLDLNLSLRDFYRGKLVDFDVEMSNDCEKCRGTGSSDGKRHTCEKCRGSGQITVHHQLAPGFTQQIRMVCDECGGVGKTISQPCGDCNGAGAVRGPRHYQVYLHRGQSRDGTVVKEGEGDRNPQWVPGDLVVRFREKLEESWGYRRIQDNLYRTEVISLNESLNGGWERKIAFFGFEEDDLNEIVLKREPGVSILDGEVEVIKGKGMPVMSDHDEDEKYGDLFIEYKVIIPGDGGNKNRKKKGVKKDEL
ncbi:SCJ1 [Candida oxycetoniae]|uniref:SCJ1 n=1 Tax=Candida oxycetoniae TaxID=497107 RepID=A0AAI9WXW3_9ASCO|nr:SCJ1 [Candida oxycetoniae]KAI3404200.2 SCJ1 [Candida oxycetoniae]